MKKHLLWSSLLAFTLCTGSMVLSSCGDDEIEPTPGQTPGGENNEQPGNQDNDKDEYVNTEKADEGRIAFVKGTSLDMDVACESTHVFLQYTADGDYSVRVNDEGSSWVNVNKGEDEGRPYSYVSILENTGAARKAVIIYSIGSYRKYVKISQRAKGDERPAEALPEYARKDFWHRTDREKMGLYGPVSYYRNSTYVDENEYFFDREGHLIKEYTGSSVIEYTYDKEGRLTYSKDTSNDDGSVSAEYFYEYNNPGKLTGNVFSAGTNYLVPDLSHYRRIWYSPWAEIYDETYTFDETGMTVASYSEIKGYGYDQHFDDNSYHVTYDGAYPASYSKFNANGEGGGFGPVEMFPNGMLKSHTRTQGTVYGYQYRMDTRISFMDYAGAMLVTRYQEVQPDYPDSERNFTVNMTYNDRKELKEVERVNVDRITFSGYIHDKYGNWIHREKSGTLWGTPTVGGWDVTDRLIDYFE